MRAVLATDRASRTLMSDTPAIEFVARDAKSGSAWRAASAGASATGLLLGLAAAKIFLQFAGIRSYGFFRDELYYMACGEHLAWGYVDQPPLIALIAWLARHLFGHSIVGLRIFPVLAGAAVVFLTGIFARELGGGRLAQSVAAVSVLFAPAFLAFDSFFSMNAFEPLFWLLCAWLVVRIVKGATPKLWLAFGIVAGLGLENKHTMLVFGFALAVGLLLGGEWRLFRSKWIWMGACVAILIFSPNLIWEARHGWPQVEVVRNAQVYKNIPTSPLDFLGEQVAFLNPIAFPLWLGGLVWYFTASEARRFRFLACTYLIVLAIFMFLGGKSYYVLPIYPILLAAGGVMLERFAGLRRRRRMVLAYVGVIVVAGIDRASIRCSGAAGEYVFALFAPAAVFEPGENGTRCDCGPAAAALRGHVRVEKHGGRRGSGVRRPTGLRSGGLRDLGRQLWRGRRDRLLRAGAWSAEGDRRTQQLLLLGASRLLGCVRDHFRRTVRRVY